MFEEGTDKNKMKLLSKQKKNVNNATILFLP